MKASADVQKARRSALLQVRSAGPVSVLTNHPVKERKLGRSIRFSEMKRDALLTHSSAYLLHDRLPMASDHAVRDACQSCGSILTPSMQPRHTSQLGRHLVGTAGELPCNSGCTKLRWDRAPLMRSFVLSCMALIG